MFIPLTSSPCSKYLSSQHKRALENVEYTRDELLRQAQDAYNRASKTGGNDYASATSYLASATNSVKDTAFDAWSKADLQKYLQSYGVKIQRGADIAALRAQAKENADYFRYGKVKQEAGVLSRIGSLGQWVFDQLKIGALSGRSEGQEAAETVKEKVSQAADEL